MKEQTNHAPPGTPGGVRWCKYLARYLGAPRMTFSVTRIEEEEKKEKKKEKTYPLVRLVLVLVLRST